MAFFGNTVKHRLESVEGKTDRAREGKRKLILHKLFAGETGGPKFKDPATQFDKKGGS